MPVVSLNPLAAADAWWAAAAANLARAPRGPLRTLLRRHRDGGRGGATSATVSDAALEWCGSLPGWSEQPLLIRAGGRARARQIKIEVTDDEYAAISRAATREGVSVSARVRGHVLRAEGLPA